MDNTTYTYCLHDMVEKPDPKDAPTNMAIIGRYILTPDILKSYVIQKKAKMEKCKLPMPF